MTNLRENEWLYDFLMGLNEEFNVVKTQILSSSSVPVWALHIILLVKMNNKEILALLVEPTIIHMYSKPHEKEAHNNLESSYLS